MNNTDMIENIEIPMLRHSKSDKNKENPKLCKVDQSCNNSKGSRALSIYTAATMKDINSLQRVRADTEECLLPPIRSPCDNLDSDSDSEIDCDGVGDSIGSLDSSSVDLRLSTCELQIINQKEHQ